jgi:hypothetical protein
MTALTIIGIIAWFSFLGVIWWLFLRWVFSH